MAGDNSHNKKMEFIVRFIDEQDKIMEKTIFVWPDNNECSSIKNPISVLKYPGLEICLEQKRILHNGVDIPLTKYEFEILRLLATHPEWIYSKETIFAQVWKENSEACFSSVTNTISRLRKKIEPDRHKPIYIKTIFGRGYMFALRPYIENGA